MTTTLDYEDEKAVKDAIAAVRNNADPKTWCIVTYTDPKAKALKLLSAGEGPLTEFVENLKDDMIAYGYCRVDDIVDEMSKTVKFVFVEIIGVDANRMQKARVTTHKSIIAELFKPYHVDFKIDSVKDISADIIQDRVGVTSGSKTRVLDAASAESMKKSKKKAK